MKSGGRRRGFRKIDTVVHRLSGKTIDIYYCPDVRDLYGKGNGPQFSAEWDGEEHNGVDIVKLKSEALRYLEETSGLEWYDIIDIALPSQFRDEMAYFGFDLNRYFISKSRVGMQYLHSARVDRVGRPVKDQVEQDRRNFATPWYDWSAGRNFRPPCRPSGHIYLAYSPEVWATLNGMQKEIERARKRFEKFLASAEGVRQMEIKGREILRMLPAPKEESDGRHAEPCGGPSRRRTRRCSDMPRPRSNSPPRVFTLSLPSARIRRRAAVSRRSEESVPDDTRHQAAIARGPGTGA